MMRSRSSEHEARHGLPRVKIIEISSST